MDPEGADRDPLTQLPRAGTFQGRLDELAREQAPEGRSGAGYVVGLVDIVGLRHINRDLGTAAGDELLRQVAQRLQGWSSTSLVARVGPDEFALLAEGVDAVDAGQWARELKSRVLRDSFELDGTPVDVQFNVSRREGPPPPGLDLFWLLQREASADASRELFQRLSAFERNYGAADRALQENAQLRELAYRDPLTGLLNRRGMPDRLAELAETDVSGGLAFVDLDNLRELNDLNELWDDGDKAIAGVAERLKEAFGPTNVSRWGGDEYLVVAPKVDVRQLGQALEHILEQCRHDLVVAGRPVTFSAGVVPFSSNTLDQARGQAQRAVKEAKRKKATVIVVPD